MKSKGNKPRVLEVVLAALIFIFTGASAEERLPAVPAGVLPPPAGGKGSAAENPPLVEGTEIVMRPGVSVVTPIAFGHLNRIVTPFDHPQVRTVSKAQIQVHDNVVYVATEEETPVTLFITPSGRESPSLPLILAPRKIPPREVSLVLPEAEKKALNLQQIHTAEKALGKDDPYVGSVKTIMKDLAKGKVPSGFAMRDPNTSDRVQCFQDGLSTRVGQVMEGPLMVLRVALLRNLGSVEIELDETRCTAPGDPIAVAAWPKVRLAPGEAVELFLLSRTEEVPPESVRPFLIGGS